MGHVASIIALFAFLTVPLLLIAVGLYVFQSLALYTLSCNAGIEYPWLSWIPIGNLYVMGKLINSIQLGDFQIPSLHIVMPAAFVVSLMFKNVSVLGTIISLLYYALTIIWLYNLTCKYRPDNAVLYTVLSAVFPFLMPIFMFVMRNDRPIS